MSMRKYGNDELYDGQYILPSAPAMSDVYQMSESKDKVAMPKVNNNFPETMAWCANVMEHVNALQNRITLLNARRRPVGSDRAAQKMFCQLTEIHGETHGRITKVDHDRDYYDSFQDKIDQIREARQAIDVLRDEHKKEEYARKTAQHQLLQQQKTKKISDLRKMKEVMLLQHRQQCLQRFGIMEPNNFQIAGNYPQNHVSSNGNQYNQMPPNFDPRFAEYENRNSYNYGPQGAYPPHPQQQMWQQPPTQNEPKFEGNGEVNRVAQFPVRNDQLGFHNQAQPNNSSPLTVGPSGNFYQNGPQYAAQRVEGNFGVNEDLRQNGTIQHQPMVNGQTQHQAVANGQIQEHVNNGLENQIPGNAPKEQLLAQIIHQQPLPQNIHQQPQHNNHQQPHPPVQQLQSLPQNIQPPPVQSNEDTDLISFD
uniref:Hrs_helical domain-containing protein n=1 Tax=Rhabditophanes sp. KR3021 TaxID=114890 RepID=A0AC35U1R6_9BILA